MGLSKDIASKATMCTMSGTAGKPPSAPNFSTRSSQNTDSLSLSFTTSRVRSLRDNDGWSGELQYMQLTKNKKTMEHDKVYTLSYRPQLDVGTYAVSEPGARRAGVAPTWGLKGRCRRPQGKQKALREDQNRTAVRGFVHVRHFALMIANNHAPCLWSVVTHRYEIECRTLLYSSVPCMVLYCCLHCLSFCTFLLH